jgi:hypothetical protein
MELDSCCVELWILDVYHSLDGISSPKFRLKVYCNSFYSLYFKQRYDLDITQT